MSALTVRFRESEGAFKTGGYWPLQRRSSYSKAAVHSRKAADTEAALEKFITPGGDDSAEPPAFSASPFSGGLIAGT